MRIIFFGSDEFAASSLERLIRDRFSVAAVVTQPDRPRGRGMNVSFLPVKMMALEQAIPILQPETLRDPRVHETLAGYEADLFVVIAYGLFLPKEILEMPRHGCVNVHGSLLPKYRGAAPIQWAIMNGETETGISVIRMSERMDAGDVLFQRAVPIPLDVDAVTLRERMADVGAACLVETLAAIDRGEAAAVPQDEGAVTLAPKLTREVARIIWEYPASRINDKIRGLVPWPGAEAVFRGKRVKIWKAEPWAGEASGSAQPGSVIAVLPERIVVACGQGGLALETLQVEGGNPMDARSFRAGYQVRPGDRFDDGA